MSSGDLDRLVQARRLDDVEAADELFRLGERAVGDEPLPVTRSDGSRAPRWRELIAGHPLPARLQVVQPGEALVVACITRSRLFACVHPLRVPADQQHVLHVTLLPVVDVPTTKASRGNRHLIRRAPCVRSADRTTPSRAVRVSPSGRDVTARSPSACATASGRARADTPAARSPALAPAGARRPCGPS